MHIDGGRRTELIPTIRQILRHLETPPSVFPSKLNTVVAESSGPQRKSLEFADSYSTHMPGQHGEESLDIFSTTSFGRAETVRQPIVDTVKSVLSRLQDAAGTVVEVERVIGEISHDGRFKQAQPATIATIPDASFSLPRSFTQAVEFHHAVDIPKRDREADQPPLALDEFNRQTRQAGLRVGAWVLFDKPDKWSFRSTQFTDLRRYKEHAQDSHAKLRSYIAHKDPSWTAWTLVEQILGVWNPGRPADERVLVHRLADWERNFDALQEFWAVIGDFLGDWEPDVRSAIKNNLNREVKYKYFLTSWADVQRLRRLGSTLSRELSKDVTSQLQPVLLLKNDAPAVVHNCCIANPRGEDRAGFRFNEDLRGEVTWARSLTTDELSEIIQVLSPIVDPVCPGIRLPALRPGSSAGLVAVFTDLENSTQTRVEVGPEDWETVLADYDRIVATEASFTNGEVVKGLGDGYLLVFESARSAFDCAVRLQRAVQEHNRKLLTDSQDDVLIPAQRIALDSGGLEKVERCHGYDYSGHALNRCSRILSAMPAGHIWVSGRCARTARDEFRGEEFPASEIDEIEGKGISGPIKCWEVRWVDLDGTLVGPERRTEL